MTGEEELLAEYWRIYEAYMARKEHLIEVTLTLYLAGASALLLQDWHKFWLVHIRSVMWLVPPVILLAAWFVREQFRLWNEGGWISSAAQSLLAQWLASPGAPRDLAPVPFPTSTNVWAPQALVTEMNRMRNTPATGGGLRGRSFAGIVYGLGALATVALALQCIWAWCRTH